MLLQLFISALEHHLGSGLSGNSRIGARAEIPALLLNAEVVGGALRCVSAGVATEQLEV